MVDLEAFIAEQLRTHPIEARIVARIVSALRQAGDPVTSIWDGEEWSAVTTLADVNCVVFNLDECQLVTKSGSWVRLVNGEEWDMLCDYSVDLEQALADVNTWILKEMS